MIPKEKFVDAGAVSLKRTERNIWLIMSRPVDGPTIRQLITNVVTPELTELVGFQTESY